jgi:hypothetical protein
LPKLRMHAVLRFDPPTLDKSSIRWHDGHGQRLGMRRQKTGGASWKANPRNPS